jgi:hypothetical protein
MRRVVGALAVLALLAAPSVAVEQAATAATCQSWGVQPPNVGVEDNSLRGVSLTKDCVAWAVGYSTDTGTPRALIERWNGSAWKTQTAPAVGASSELSGVAALSPTNAWAVGTVDNGPDQGFVLHWNGTAWSQKTSPNPGATDNDLFAVAAVSASNVWAVGRYASGPSPFQTLIEHWNGTSWTHVTSPNVGTLNNELEGVAVVSASNIWAVGDSIDIDTGQSKTLILHWNGTKWKRVPSPNVGTEPNELRGVTAVSATNAWAVGGHGFTDRTLILHWNGTSWKRQKSPNVGSFQNGLWGVAAASASTVRAVGHFEDGATQIRFLVLLWNGTAWKVESKGPADHETNFWAIDATSATNAWAVGDAGSTPSATLAVHCC